MRPLIGITTRNGKDADKHPLTALQNSYLNAVRQAGGLPIPIPNALEEDELADLYARLDGILLSGGGDIDPETFGGESHPRVDGVDPSRDFTELFLMRAAAQDGKPALGICRGAQLMNVALGGTLYTHLYAQLPGALDHAYPGNLRRVIVHEVKVEANSRAAQIFGETLLNVNSLHHQGIKDLAPSLRATGCAPDGLTETVELRDHPFGLAVQWHPEWLTDQLPMRRLFRAFVEACEK